MHWLWLFVLIVLAAMASSRSVYWNTVFCRLWLLLSALWITLAWYLTDAHGHVEWAAVVFPPIGVLLSFAALHWVFSGLYERAARR